ncbi:MAG: ABC transporter permease [Planctomycetaceae bacterium]|nr:ABC transporter permease [Planctomycetaceae bacterium]
MTDFFQMYGWKLAEAVLVHLYYVVISVALAFIIAVLMAVVLSRLPRLSRVILPAVSVSQTIPGIVFIGVLFIFLGMVPLTVFTALTIYAIFPILKNTYVGIMEVEPQYKEAALGCGMSARQTLCMVELPLAAPAIFTGLKMSCVYTVSWAVLASMIGLGGLGEFIYIGVSTNNNALILAGAIPAAVMAVILSYCIERLKIRSLTWQQRREIQ